MTDTEWIPPRIEPEDTAGLALVEAVIERGPFSDTWESLSSYRVPSWFPQAKFGIFVHWGVFSVPAFGDEWYARHMYQAGTPAYEHHAREYGHQASFGYKDFMPALDFARFDAIDMAALFRRAGAQFVVPVAEHHDGFAMYDEPRSRWKAPLIGPQRDPLGELTAAVRDQSMFAGASSHRAEHWFYFNGGMAAASDVRDPEFSDLYGPAQREEVGPSEQFLDDWLLRTVSIIDRYKPQVLWFDWWIDTAAFEPYLRKLAAYYYNRAAEWGRGVVIQYKLDAFRPGTAVFDVERGSEGSIRPDVWQCDTSVSRTSWGWVEGHEYKSSVELIGELIDVVSKNGCLLLNIGPKPDGTIPDGERALLEEIGAWLDVHGEAVYGTVPWVISGEGPTKIKAGNFTDSHPLCLSSRDWRFTAREVNGAQLVYATAVVWPESGEARIRAFGSSSGAFRDEIASVQLVGAAEQLEFRVEEDALVVALPATRPSAHGLTLKVRLRVAKSSPRDHYMQV